MNPILLCMDSHFPFPMASDIVIPIVLVSWYCVHYVPYYYELVELPIIKHVVLVGFECVRAFLIQLWALRAATHIKPSYFFFPSIWSSCLWFYCRLWWIFLPTRTQRDHEDGSMACTIRISGVFNASLNGQWGAWSS